MIKVFIGWYARALALILILTLSACVSYRVPTDLAPAKIAVQGTGKKLTLFKEELLKKLKVKELDEASITCKECSATIDPNLPMTLNYMVPKHACQVYQIFGDTWKEVQGNPIEINFRFAVLETVTGDPPVCAVGCKYYPGCGNICVKKVANGVPPDCTKICP